MTLTGIPSFSETFTASSLQLPLDVQRQKTVTKVKAITSIPCFLITCIANVLSNPPDSKASAVVISG
jgi:hypothetical protein